MHPPEAGNSRKGNSPHTYFSVSQKTVNLLCSALYHFLSASELGQSSVLRSLISPKFSLWHSNRLVTHRHTTHLPRTMWREQEEQGSKAQPLQDAVPAQGCSSASSHPAPPRGCSWPVGTMAGAPRLSLSHTRPGASKGQTDSLLSPLAGRLATARHSHVLPCHMIVPVKPRACLHGFRVLQLGPHPST